VADGNSQDARTLQQRVQTIADYQDVFGTDAGRRVLRDLEDFAGLLSDGFDPDPNVTAYHAGRRSVGVYILRMLELDRDQLQRMVRDQTQTVKE